MATSPNYSWPEPDNTDLVKNGALAMRTLGNAIDTTMATMTPKSTVTAKGSLIAATAASTPANLAVGNNGETLVADSSTATGLRYQVPVNVNPVLNSAFQVWQRGTTLTYSGTQQFIADRWEGYNNGTSMTISRQATNDTTNLPFIQYCARVQRAASSTNVNGNYVQQNFETINSVPFAGKTVTLSFYARAGANYSSTSNAMKAYLVSGTGTDQNWLRTGYTGSVTAIDATATLTTTWQRFSYTATLASTATELTVAFFNIPTGTAGANDYFEVTGVQLEVGSVATPFKTNGGTIQGELAACQRYYQRYANAGNSSNYYGSMFSSSGGIMTKHFPVAMRVSPTVTLPATSSGCIQYVGVGSLTPTAYATEGITTTTHGFFFTGASGGATGAPIIVIAGTIELSAEL